MIKSLKHLFPLHIMVAGSTLASKFIVAGTQLISIRYVLKNLDVEVYSIFALLSALAAWALLSDFGLGSAIQNFISENRAQNTDEKQVVFTGLIAVVIMTFAAILVVFMFSPFLAPLYLKGANFLEGDEKTRIFEETLIIFIISSLGVVAQKIWFAYQRGWLGNIFPAISSLISLLCLMLIDIKKFNQPIIGVIYIFFLPGSIISLLAIYLSCPKLIRPVYLNFNFRLFIDLIKRGGSFWIFLLSASLVLQADYLVISQILNAEDVLVYSVMQKIFGFALFIYIAILQALWPICTELGIKKQWENLYNISRKHIMYGLISIILFTILFYLFRAPIMVSLASSVTPSALLITSFGLYYALRVWTDTFGMLMQSMNMLAPLWFLVPTQAVLTIFFETLLAKEYGLLGIMGGLIIGYLMTVAFFCPIIVHKYIKNRM